MPRNKNLNIFFQKPSKGSIIPQLLVVAGVISGLSLGVMNMTQVMNKSQESLENRFEMAALEDEIQMALRSRVGCRRTVSGVNLTSNPGQQINEIRDGYGNPGDPGRLIISRGDIIGRSVDGSGNKNTTTPEFTITDIRVTAYADKNGASSANPGQITSYVSGVAQDYDYGPALVSVYIDKGDTSDAAANEKMQKQKSYSSQTFRKDFEIEVLVDTSSSIVDCNLDDSGMGLEAFCDSLGGLFSGGLCKEISIQEDSSDSTSYYAINSQGPMLVNSSGASVIGNFVPASEAPSFPEAGNLYTENNFLVGGNKTVVGDLLVQGGEPSPPPGQPLPAASIEGNVGIGRPQVGTRDLIIQGDAGDPDQPGAIVNRDADFIHILNQNSEVINIRNWDAGNIPGVRVNLGAGNTEGMIELGLSDRFAITHTGKIVIENPGLNGTRSLDIGSGTTTYFPAYIRNQPTTVPTTTGTYSSVWDVTGSRGDEAATKRWVASSLYAHLTSGIEGVIIGNITSSYQGNNQLKALDKVICEESRMRIDIGGGSASTGAYLDGSYAGNGCDFEVRHCNSGTDRCGVLFTNGINSDGQIFTNNRIKMKNGTSEILVRNNGSIDATGRIESNTQIRAPTIYGQVRVCTPDLSSCTTRFDRQICPWPEKMVGLSHGFVVCAER